MHIARFSHYKYLAVALVYSASNIKEIMASRDLSYKSPFLLPWSKSDKIRCLDEQLIIAISYQIRLKTDWKTKYKNADIVSKWRAEFNEQEHNSKHADEVLIMY